MNRFALATLSAMLLAGCAAPQVKRVAIMDFENATGNPANEGLSLAVPEYLMGIMANEKPISLIERQDMNRYLGARYGDDFKRLRYDRWREIGQRLRADYFITGSVSMLENNFIVTARLYSVATGQVVPGSAKTVSCARAADIYPSMRPLSEWFVYQIKHRQPSS
ncbi:MAG: hypothetical protein BWZ10_02169 [candidate division BRC1 bacterium ADurb.BinA364]|nr:MAG: hypothetical protein BWZ10_02169 [candidate division BRC1 bacterium ADurb.BinA364]